MVRRNVALLSGAMLGICMLSGCGLAETGAAAAAGGASAAEQARQAKQTEDKMRQQIDDAEKKGAEAREAAEKAANE